MQYKDFCQSLSSLLSSQFPENTFLNVHTVSEGNGILSEVLTIEAPGNSILPMFKLKDYYASYSDGVSLYEIKNEISRIYAMETVGQSPEISKLSDFESVREHIVFRLMGSERNRRLLSRLPHRKYLDLAIVYELRQPLKSGCFGSALIEKEQQELWGVTESELYQAALVNTPRLLPRTLLSLTDMLRQMSESLENIPELADPDSFFCFEEGSIPMYVLSNSARSLGAAALLYPGCLEKIGKRLGAFYLLPSSVHECILVPRLAYVDPRDLRDTVREVNRSLVDAAEILSGSLYLYEPGRGLDICRI